VGVPNKFMTEDLEVLSAGASEMRNDMQKLDTAIAHARQWENRHAYEEAKEWRDCVLPAMDKLRETTDRLESMIDEADWPIPNYVDLLFGV